MVFDVSGSRLDIELLNVIFRKGSGSLRVFHKGAEKKVGISHNLGWKHIRAV